jgi:TMEM175 potassium channel family protein
MAAVEEVEHRRYERSLNRSRVLTLSDGVFAIAMTLLVLELRVPERTVVGPVDVLREIRPSFIAFLISFFVIASAWANHRDLFEVIRLTDRNLVWLNLVYLLPLAMIPFGAALLSRYGADRVSLTIYGGLLLVIALMRLVIWMYATSRPHLLFEPVGRELRRAGVLLVVVPIAFYIVAIVLAQAGHVAEDVSLVIYALVPVLYFVTIIFTPPQLRPFLHHSTPSGIAGPGDRTGED